MTVLGDNSPERTKDQYSVQHISLSCRCYADKCSNFADVESPFYPRERTIDFPTTTTTRISTLPPRARCSAFYGHEGKRTACLREIGRRRLPSPVVYCATHDNNASFAAGFVSFNAPPPRKLAHKQRRLAGKKKVTRDRKLLARNSLASSKLNSKVDVQVANNVLQIFRKLFRMRHTVFRVVFSGSLTYPTHGAHAIFHEKSVRVVASARDPRYRRPPREFHRG